MEERNLLQLNRKAVSLMVGYVLLIAIAIALATAVFFYLKLYLPNETSQCDSNIKLTIDEVNCKLSSTQSTIEINISNRGFFKVEGAYIKIGEFDRTYRQNLNDFEDGFSSSICNPNPTLILNPDEKFCGIYHLNSPITTPQEISVQPVVWINNKPVLCSNAVVSKRLDCT